MTKVIPIISDIQYPLHDRKAVDVVATFVADLGVPTVCIGDEIDAWQVSRWCKARAGEFDGGLEKARDEIGPLLAALGVTHLTRSNHGNTRLESYLSAGAPALAGLPELRYEAFLRLDVYGIQFHRQPYKIAPGWVAVHGDEGGYSQAAGGTALLHAKKWGKSVVCGHTHKLGLQHGHQGFSGRIMRELWGFEVGNLMDMTKAGYLKGGYGNWQQGIGVLLVDGKNVTPVPIPIRNGVLHFDGKRYKA
jgi:hypothetical protein